MRSSWWAVALLAGCGDSGSADADAAPVVIDAALDAHGGPPALDRVCGGGLAAPGVQASWYVIDSLLVPSSSAAANSVAMNVDGFSGVENALGTFLGILGGLGIEHQVATDEAVSEGRQLQLVAVATETPVVSEAVTVLVRVGADQDDDAGDNYSGAESFDLVETPSDGALPGRLAGSFLCAGLAPAPILVTLRQGRDPITLPVFAAKVEVDHDPDGLTLGRLGGAITIDVVDELLVPELRAACNDLIQEDCPDMQCDEGSPGEELAMVFDDDNDLVISLEEFLSNDIVDGYLRDPDLDLLDGDVPGSDGTKESLSFGFGFNAVTAVVP